MAGNRKAAEAFLLDMIEQIAPGGENKKIYEQLLAEMSDIEFDKLMKSYENGTSRPVIYAPLGKSSLDVKRNIKLAEKLGHSFFQKLLIGSTDPNEEPYLTPVKYMVMDLMFRRQAQLLTKKISIPEHNNSMNQLTGQPTGASKSARMSYPETQVLRSMGLEDSLVELLKMRGGDIKGFDTMNRVIARDGTVSLKAIEHLSSGVESTKALKTYLTCMHLESTL